MDLFPVAHLDLARRLLAACEAEGIRLVTAESCTGGLIAGCLTEIAGSSAVVERGYVVYSNEAKQEMLGVPAALLLRQHGAVSEPVARAMAEGALARSGCGLALAVTGIAGPGGATASKPVGLVHLACARSDAPTLHRAEVFAGDRTEVRVATVEAAILLALAGLGAASQSSNGGTSAVEYQPSRSTSSRA
jgi:nicotinamide-nucleotide amidase